MAALPMTWSVGSMDLTPGWREGWVWDILSSKSWSQPSLRILALGHGSSIALRWSLRNARLHVIAHCCHLGAVWINKAWVVNSFWSCWHALLVLFFLAFLCSGRDGSQSWQNDKDFHPFLYRFSCFVPMWWISISALSWLKLTIGLQPTHNVIQEALHC